jgi:small subunit ribosomal protein S1
VSEQANIEAIIDAAAEGGPSPEGAAAPRSDGESVVTPTTEARPEDEAPEDESEGAAAQAEDEAHEDELEGAAAQAEDEAHEDELEGAAAQAEDEAAARATEEETGDAGQRKRRRRRRRRTRVVATVPADVEVKVIPPKRIVKPLHRGMEVEGTVRRLAEFGAFIDIGVGTDGLVHISELSTTRVNKVSDVLKEGQQVTAWIKDLDREHNRISLTMIAPGTKTIRTLEEGEIVQGTVTRLAPYGAFIDIGVGRDAMLHVREMAEGYVAKPEDVVQIGQTIEARVIAVDRRRQRIDLSLKGLRPEPEPSQVMPSMPAPAPSRAPEPEPDEPELPSVMAFAFQKAFGEDFNFEERRERRPKRRRREREEYDEEMEQIMSRTLRYRGER